MQDTLVVTIYRTNNICIMRLLENWSQWGPLATWIKKKWNQSTSSSKISIHCLTLLYFLSCVWVVAISDKSLLLFCGWAVTQIRSSKGCFYSVFWKVFCCSLMARQIYSQWAFHKLHPLSTYFHSVCASSWRVRHIKYHPKPMTLEWMWRIKPSHSKSALCWLTDQVPHRVVFIMEDTA